MEDDTPVMEDDTPVMEDDTPVMEDDTPVMEDNTPVSEADTSASTVAEAKPVCDEKSTPGNSTLETGSIFKIITEPNGSRSFGQTPSLFSTFAPKSTFAFSAPTVFEAKPVCGEESTPGNLTLVTGSMFKATTEPKDSGPFGQTPSVFGTSAVESIFTFAAPKVFEAKPVSDEESTPGNSTLVTESMFRATTKPNSSGSCGQTSSFFSTSAAKSTFTFAAPTLCEAKTVCDEESTCEKSTLKTGSIFKATTEPNGPGSFGQTTFTFGTPAPKNTFTFRASPTVLAKRHASAANFRVSTVNTGSRFKATTEPTSLMYSHFRTPFSTSAGAFKAIPTFGANCTTSNGCGSVSSISTPNTGDFFKATTQPAFKVRGPKTVKESPDFVETSTQTQSDFNSENLSDDLNGLMLNGDCSDFTVEVKGLEFLLHRCILSARSPIFKSMFNHEMAERVAGRVSVDDCEVDVFRAFVRYVYTGRTDQLHTDTVFEVFALADKYQVDGLKSACIAFIMNTLSVDTFCDVVQFALVYENEELLEEAADFLSANTSQVMKTVQWIHFLAANHIQANELLLKVLDKKQH